MCTVLLPPGDNPIAVNKYINIRIRGNGEFVHAGTFDFISSCLYNMKIYP